MQKYGNDAEYQVGMPIPRKGWQITQKITDDLKHLLEIRELSVIDGEMILPTGDTYDLSGVIAPEYLHFSSLSINLNKGDINESPITQISVRIMTESEFSLISSSEINTPTMRFPKASFKSDSIRILPKTIYKATFSYLRQPIEPNWKYVLVDGRPVYDPITSVDLDAPTSAFNDIAMLTLNLMGINLRDADITQYSQGKHQEGV